MLKATGVPLSCYSAEENRKTRKLIEESEINQQKRQASILEAINGLKHSIETDIPKNLCKTLKENFQIEDRSFGLDDVGAVIDSKMHEMVLPLQALLNDIKSKIACPSFSIETANNLVASTTEIVVTSQEILLSNLSGGIKISYPTYFWGGKSHYFMEGFSFPRYILFY